jgi:hypothetical protein
LSGYGINLRIEANEKELEYNLIIPTSESSLIGKILTSPNGCNISFENAEGQLPQIPQIKQSFVLNKNSKEAFHVGRSGMLYRDLIKCRLGGNLN